MDYNIGYDLWIALSKDEQELFKQIRQTAKSNQQEQKSKNHPSHPASESNLKIVDSIVKKAEDKTIPKQYGQANTTITEQSSEGDEEINNMSIIDYIIDNAEGVQAIENIKANNTRFFVSLTQCKANLQYTIQLAKFIRKLLNILDTGADTHVFGA